MIYTPQPAKKGKCWLRCIRLPRHLQKVPKTQAAAFAFLREKEAI